MTKTLKDRLQVGGVKGVWFKDSRKKINGERINCPNAKEYSGIYTILGFIQDAYLETCIKIIDKNGLEEYLNLALQLDDKEYHPAKK